MKKDIILIGGGGHCRSCIDVIEAENKFAIKGIVDLAEQVGKSIIGYPVIGTDDDLKNLSQLDTSFLITIGQLRDPFKRVKIFQMLKDLGAKMPSIVSPHAYVSKHTNIGAGTIVMHHAIVNACAQIGDNCIINTKALVEHDAVIGSHSHISTGAIVNGGVKIGENSFYGSGAVSKEYIELPGQSFIKANQLVK
jgi:sugar O-acyltransferase (sialic acid O-acetyltransferase NeuD family)